MSRYPGQCVHNWVGDADKQKCACGASCVRDLGKIVEYESGDAISKPAPIERKSKGERR